MDKLLSARELAECLGLKEQTIYNRLNLGKSLPPVIKMGRLLRFPEAGVMLWLSAQSMQSKAVTNENQSSRKRGRPTKAQQIAKRQQNATVPPL